jgi:hypothetical protein
MIYITDLSFEEEIIAVMVDSWFTIQWSLATLIQDLRLKEWVVDQDSSLLLLISWPFSHIPPFFVWWSLFKGQWKSLQKLADKRNSKNQWASHRTKNKSSVIFSIILSRISQKNIKRNLKEKSLSKSEILED